MTCTGPAARAPMPRTIVGKRIRLLLLEMVEDRRLNAARATRAMPDRTGHLVRRWRASTRRAIRTRFGSDSRRPGDSGSRCDRRVRATEPCPTGRWASASDVLAGDVVEDGLGVEAAIPARVGERSASAAAEVEAVLVEDARRGRVGDGNVSKCRGVCHGQPSARVGAVGVPAGCPSGINALA